mmetsp:Transcript_11683/g.17148  ORF Transcript_11683/g.17148 Transcript_11683/m.17148 type:complete len:393 (+) Transcript_11683:81-1259(+)|eukprot:CAMPEP_0194224340 /NCGR_PEP_ID=MMETSP0156-20130528/37220_1 /TAXON_ID=33649 /ORGANISM="Thalassionema nitzschioides, Strain L26-B" /LENGTH=392 /DNA_ID=CAMNT_0038955863 /DNA_START=76 /DNA_END=1254 /DNA_ORIENTATION=-
MAKTKTKTVTSKKKIKKSKPKKELSASDFIEQGDLALDSLDVNKALECYQSAIPQLEDDKEKLADVMAKLGECKVSMGDQDGARDAFEQAINLIPEGPNHKRAGYYLYLGQLSLEEEALEAYQKGIQELENCIRYHTEKMEVEEQHTEDCQKNGEESPISVKDLKQQLALSHCTVAELFLTDLCYAENAEKDCEFHVESAMNIADEPIIDALQVMASLRLSQQKEAKPYILKVYNQMKEGCDALATMVGLSEPLEEGAVELSNVEAVNNLPSFEFRCQSVKLLLECGSDECVQAAIQVLGSLLAENDEVVEIWYLLGCAFEMNGGNELAIEYWQRAREMLLKVKENLQQDDDDEDDEIVQQLNECQDQILDIENKLKRSLEAEGKCDETMEQ